MCVAFAGQFLVSSPACENCKSSVRRQQFCGGRMSIRNLEIYSMTRHVVSLLLDRVACKLMLVVLLTGQRYKRQSYQIFELSCCISLCPGRMFRTVVKCNSAFRTAVCPRSRSRAEAAQRTAFTVAVSRRRHVKEVFAAA